MKRKLSVRAWLHEFLVALAVAATMTPATAGEVTVSDAWIRAMPANLPAAGYFTLHNGTTREVTLTGAQSPVCGMLMLHKSTNDNGMAMMMEMPTVPVAPGASAKFAPGGFHLMCSDPSPKLKPGSTVSVTLQFAEGSALVVTFAVRNARGH